MSNDTKITNGGPEGQAETADELELSQEERDAAMVAYCEAAAHEQIGKHRKGIEAACLAVTSLRASRLSEANALISDMLSLLMTDVIIKEPLLPSDRAWMARAEAYFKSTRRLVVESPEAAR